MLRLQLALAGAGAISPALALAWFGLVHLFERHAYRTQTDDLDAVVRQVAGGPKPLRSFWDGKLDLPADEPKPRQTHVHETVGTDGKPLPAPSAASFPDGSARDCAWPWLSNSRACARRATISPPISRRASACSPPFFPPPCGPS